MDENMRSRLAESVRSFHIPRLGEIPDVGLYLEQVTRYVNQSITGCGLSPITASMVSNYVKQKIIPGPEKKAYGAESIAYLIFVSCIKSVVAMDDIRALIGIQHEICRPLITTSARNLKISSAMSSARATILQASDRTSRMKRNCCARHF